MPYGCDGKLRYPANGHASHEKHATTADLGDNTAVDNDDEDAHCGQNTCVHEGATNSGDLEKVRAVRCRRLLAPWEKKLTEFYPEKNKRTTYRSCTLLHWPPGC